jgi:hypothetical protein
MLTEVHRPTVARLSGRQLALPLMPFATSPPPVARTEVAAPEQVWPGLGPTARARVRRAFVAVLQEARHDRVGG